MNDCCTNSGCACKPNHAIKCSVSSCANHCKSEQYCGLDSIRVGTHECHPSQDQCTDCLSFQEMR
ncbi:MAG: DUF1540 domain-containing protein [Oscillospiraceae bacterium]|nr:DUF1540 domain-containing protein [Oscillospiraceae bacterium]